MKISAFFLLVAVMSLFPVKADDLTTRDGKVYKNYKVMSHDDAYLTILYADGGGKIPLGNLPDALQKQYGYDPAKATAALKASDAADQAAQEQLKREKADANARREKQANPDGTRPAAAAAPSATTDTNNSTVDVATNEVLIANKKMELTELQGNYDKLKNGLHANGHSPDSNQLKALVALKKSVDDKQAEIDDLQQQDDAAAKK